MGNMLTTIIMSVLRTPAIGAIGKMAEYFSVHRCSELLACNDVASDLLRMIGFSRLVGQ